jgi:cytidylate kinase
VVAEGRDTGTVVFPDAECKFFLDATPEERTRRRYLQLQQQGRAAEFETILAQIIQRDHNDSNRDLAPLRPAEDALIIDSSRMSAHQVVAAMLQVVRARQAVA